MAAELSLLDPASQRLLSLYPPFEAGFFTLYCARMSVAVSSLVC